MGEFCIEFGHRRYKGLGVRVSSEGLEILTGESTLNNQIRLLAPNAIPKQSIRIFLDVGSIEV